MDHSESEGEAAASSTLNSPDSADSVAPIGTPPLKTDEETVHSGSDTEAGAKVRPWWRLQGCLVGLITGLITSVAIAFYLTPTGQATLTALRHLVVKPTCANQQWLLQVPDNEIFANAYYIQSDTIPNYSVYHRPNYTIDGDLGTAWLQQLPAGQRSNWIEWSFNQRYDIRLICVVDGWAEDSRTYARTYPIGTASVYATNPDKAQPRSGPLPASPTCPDATTKFKDYLQPNGFVNDGYQWQSVSFHCLTSNIVLYIDSVSGKSVKNRRHDVWGPPQPLTGISEIRFYYCPTILCWLPTHKQL
jgi:hypothetical protein